MATVTVHFRRNLAQLRRNWSQFRVVEHGPVLLLLLFTLLIPFATPRVYATDEVQYYVYLRSLRFDGDLDFANEYREFHTRNPRSGIDKSLLQPNRIRKATGLYGNIAPVGAALMWSPFFLLADVLVQIANALGVPIPADGYSWPYTYAVCYASALYGLLGLLLGYHLVRRYATPFATTLASVAIWLATPLVFYMFIQMPFAHATGFFLVALFLTLWERTRDRWTTGRQAPGLRGWGAWAGLGIAGGMMTMTREQLGLFLLVPAIEGLVSYWNCLKGSAQREPGARLALLRGLFARHVLFLGVFLLALAPQLIVYQVLNGQMRPSTEVSGKFRDTWYSPCFFHTLVDPTPCLNSPGGAFAHGALLWSPVLVPALLGLLLLWRRDRLLSIALALAVVAQTYTNGAISTWHLSSAFGFRRLIECTPIFILGLALLLDWMRPRINRGWLVAPALLLIGWNAGLIVNWTILHPDLRVGLIWPDLWAWQLEVPARVLERAGQILFDRCKFLENGGC